MKPTDLDVVVKQVDWNKNKELLRSIREQVFIIEQHVPREIEWDNADEEAIHFLAYSQDEQPIACARLFEDGKFGRMAVVKTWRNKGIGSLLLNAVIQNSKGKFDQLKCHAQTGAISFYQKAGFVSVGKRFTEAGIEHQEMVLKL